MAINLSRNGELEHLTLSEAPEYFRNYLIKGSSSELLGFESVPQILDAAGLCVCLEGKLVMTIDSRNYTLRHGDMCVVFANDIVSVAEKSEDFKGYVVACPPEFIDNFNIPSGTAIYLYVKDNPVISLSDRDMEDLIKHLKFIKIMK